MIMCIQNLVKFCPSILKILSKNQFLTSIKGCNSVANLRKMTLYNSNIDLVNGNVYTNLVKFCPSILKILIKNQFLISIKGRNSASLGLRSGQNSNSVQTCWLSLLPAKMKKIQSKMLALECSQHYTSIFQTCKGR